MKLLNSLIILVLLFVTACNKSSPGSSTSSSQNSSTESFNCIEGQTETKVFYQNETIKFGETCVSQASTRSCQKGNWTDLATTSYTAITCTVLPVSDEEVTHDLAFYLTTCGEISNISECVHFQKLIHEELL